MSERSDPRVSLSKYQGGGEVPASFERCVLTAMGCSENQMLAGYSYSNGRLEIYPSAQGVKFMHPTGCPCRFLTGSDIANIPESTTRQGVKVAVAGLLESSDGHVLLTRRAQHMRTFPCVWVPPGGHVEPGETLNQAFLRELSEETGLTFSEGDVNLSTLGLWESVFPPILSNGLPVRHHVIVYFLARAQEDHRTLQGRLSLQHKEVDASTWLDEATATEAAQSDDFGQSRKVPQRYFKATVIENSQPVEKNLPLSILMSSLPPSGANAQERNIERLSTGTKFALRQWLQFLYSPPPGGFQRGDSYDTVFQEITKAGHQPVKSPFWGK